MCYWNTTEYRIIPISGYQVLRNCPGCGCRAAYESTGSFRVNANGKRIDVWLIYRCKSCGHTYNLTIYERVKPEDIPGEEYRRFLENDGETALRYGMDKGVFARNRAEIDWEHVAYEIRPMEARESLESRERLENRESLESRERPQSQENPESRIDRQGRQDALRHNRTGSSLLTIHNPWGLKIRTDKAVAEICQVSRSKVRQLVKEGKLELPQDYVGSRIVLELGRTGWTDWPGQMGQAGPDGLSGRKNPENDTACMGRHRKEEDEEKK